jgi:hypothetical protein
MSVVVAVRTGKYDIFLKLPDGQPVWIKAEESLEQARMQVVKMAKDAPGDYFIFNARNGQLLAA